MTEPDLPYPLDLGDGREPIMCRDAHQASLLLGLWRAWNGRKLDIPTHSEDQRDLLDSSQKLDAS